MQNKALADIFYKEWNRGVEKFLIHTSGSTGEPKPIILLKKWMIWSAQQTAQYLKPNTNDKILCCLPLNKVGGMMQLVRGLVWQVEIQIEEPSSNPLLVDTDCTIVSLTPFQMYYILQDAASIKRLRHFREVVIGGSDISESIIQQINSLDFKQTNFRHSYGMTETYAHLALKTINGSQKSDWFTPFSEAEISVNEQQCAQIKVPFEDKILQTNDVIELNEVGGFRVLGRADNIINTGGLKLQPEIIEKAIRDYYNLSETFYISSQKDEILGQRLILITEPNFKFNLNDLGFLKTISPYAVPREIVVVDKLKINEGGKVARKK